MIVQEKITCKNGKELIHTYSNKNYYLIQIQTNVKYSEAYDNIPCVYTYEEANEKIEEYTTLQD